MYRIEVTIVEGDFDVFVKEVSDEESYLNTRKGIIRTVEVDVPGHAASMIKHVPCYYVAVVGEREVTRTVQKIKQSYREELNALLEKVEALDKDIIAAVKAARPSRR